MPYNNNQNNNGWNRSEPGFWKRIDDILFKTFPLSHKQPNKDIFQAVPIDPYDITLSTTKQPLLQPTGLYKKIYYIVVYVKTMDTNVTTAIYVDTQSSAGKVTLNNYNSNAEWEAPYRSWLDLSNYKVSCDAGSPVVTVWGVAYV